MRKFRFSGTLSKHDVDGSVDMLLDNDDDEKKGSTLDHNFVLTCFTMQSSISHCAVARVAIDSIHA